MKIQNNYLRVLLPCSPLKRIQRQEIVTNIAEARNINQKITYEHH